MATGKALAKAILKENNMELSKKNWDQTRIKFTNHKIAVFAIDYNLLRKLCLQIICMCLVHSTLVLNLLTRLPWRHFLGKQKF